MPLQCCIPDCKSNPDNFAVFNFPEDEVRKSAWITAIRENYSSVDINKSSTVCIKHFAGKYISTTLVLTDQAIPTLFSTNKKDTCGTGTTMPCEEESEISLNNTMLGTNCAERIEISLHPSVSLNCNDKTEMEISDENMKRLEQFENFTNASENRLMTDQYGNLSYKPLFVYNFDFLQSNNKDSSKNKANLITFEMDISEQEYNRLLACDYCPKRFKYNSDLVRHIRIHTGEKPYQCNICKKHFSQNSRLKRHMVIHTKISSFKCYTCKKCFGSRCDLIRHLAIHVDKKPFVCHCCHKPYAQFYCLKQHLKKHNVTEVYKCSTCINWYTSKLDFQIHVNQHVKKALFQCSYCGKCFHLKYSLRRHIIRHIGVSSFKCTICLRCWPSMSELQRHMRTHSTIEKFYCDYCDISFYELQMLTLHNVMLHTLDSSNKCQENNSSMYCMENAATKFVVISNNNENIPNKRGDENFFSIDDKKQTKTGTTDTEYGSKHIKSEHNNNLLDQVEVKMEETLPQIEYGSSQYSLAMSTLSDVVRKSSELKGSYDTLKKILGNETSGPIEYGPDEYLSVIENPELCVVKLDVDNETINLEDTQCSEEENTDGACVDKEETNSSTIKGDFFSNHFQNGANKQLTCMYCYKEFRTNSDLNRHVRIHTGEKPFECNFCPKSFTQLTGLKRHLVQHTGKSDFQCEVCNKCFSARSDLKRHVPTHGGRKMYHCIRCNKSYAQPHNLRNHLTTHIND